MISIQEIASYNHQFQNASPEELLRFFYLFYGSRDVVLASSLGAEDQVLTDMVSKIADSPRVIVLDTGRLNQETYDVLDISRKRYGIRYEIYFPDAKKVEDMVRQKGVNLFYESVENRKLCCYIRKVEPLRRALSTRKAWITGLRREQSVTRQTLNLVEWDETHGILKLNPLAFWTTEQVWSYIRTHNVPYNTLHDQGYPSIGCAPCTRAIQPGENIRAGRWWWENPEYKECGLHVKNGKLVKEEKKENTAKEEPEEADF